MSKCVTCYYVTRYESYQQYINCDFFFFFQAEDGIRDIGVTGVQTCALPISGADGNGPTGGASPWRLGSDRGLRSGSAEQLARVRLETGRLQDSSSQSPIRDFA